MVLGRRFLLWGVVVLLTAVFGAAADITYTVGGWGPNQYPAPTPPPEGTPWGPNGYPGDTLQLLPYTGTLPLQPGTYELPVNTLCWLIDYTYGGEEDAWDYPAHWHDVIFNIVLQRTISFQGGPSGTLTQGMELKCTWFNDYLTIFDGNTSSFIVVVGCYEECYRVDVTPLGASAEGTNFKGKNPWRQPDITLKAKFTVTQLPTPRESLQALMDKVKASGLHQGITNSLLSKLQEALEELNACDIQDALGALQAFINEVRAQSGKKIPVGQANSFIADVQEIIQILKAGH